MSVTITEILGTDSIAGSRLTINSNFLLLENAYNDLEDSFNINVLTGSLDLSTASSGQIKAKSILSNSMVLPSSGSPSVEIYGAGASAGYGVFGNTVASATGIFSNNLLAKNFSATGTALFGGTATFSSTIESNGALQIGLDGIFINKSRKASVSATTAFPLFGSSPNAAVTGTYDNPYVFDLKQNVIYIDSTKSTVVSGTTRKGFYMKVSDLNGQSPSLIPAGFTITLIDVPSASAPGTIHTGIQGSASYYTGFCTNSTHCGYASSIAIPAPKPYRTFITLMWEPRIAQISSTEKGSWVILSASSGITIL
jgi:hypothetical protein